MNLKLKLLLCFLVAILITMMVVSFFPSLMDGKYGYTLPGLLLLNNFLVVIGGYKLVSLLYASARALNETGNKVNRENHTHLSESHAVAIAPAVQPEPNLDEDRADLASNLNTTGSVIGLQPDNQDNNRNPQSSGPTDDEILFYNLTHPPMSERFQLIEERGPGEGYIVKADGLKLQLRSSLDYYLVNNIFLREVYNYILDGPTVVVDIGANVGYSVVWFAHNKNVIKVFAFEPIKSNVEKAEMLVRLNPELASKVDLKNVGLSDTNQKTSVLFFPDHHTISSLYIADGQEGLTREQNPQHEEIEVVNAQAALDEVIDFQQKQNCKLVLKVDCEGAEHKILKALNPSTWDAIDAILMEGHGKNFQELPNLLVAKGFSVFSINHTKHHLFDHCGDIYAVRKSSAR